MPKGLLDSAVYAAMQTDKPYKSYIKKIIGKVSVYVLNPFSGEPEVKLLKGLPKSKKNSDCIVDVWSEMEDAYFKRTNRKQFEMGNITPYVRPENEPMVEPTVNELSDEQLLAMLKLKYFELAKRLGEFTSISPLYRILDIARENDKTEKIIKLIESKISEFQQEELGSNEDDE